MDRLKLYDKAGRATADLRYMYRNVFGTPEGRIVLTSILQELKVFSYLQPGDVAGHAVKSAGEAILWNLAPYSHDASNTIHAAIMSTMDAFMSMPFPEKPNGKEK